VEVSRWARQIEMEKRRLKAQGAQRIHGKLKAKEKKIRIFGYHPTRRAKGKGDAGSKTKRE